MIGSLTPGASHGPIGCERGGGGVEQLGRGERRSVGVLVRGGEGDGERAVVALEHRELQVAEVAADRALADRRLARSSR